jgi:23S rRNA (cytosine1962-C5)-methyltransferase
VEVRTGHKTGYYLDQRDNREAVMRYSRGREVLNAFSYTGGFAVAGLRGGATRAVNLDTSAEALALARKNIERNALDASLAEYEEADVFHQLRRYRDSRRQFDLIVLDPPKFAEAQSQVDGAARGYKDINLLACKLLRPGGILFTFSCSGAINADLFQKIVAGAALDAKRDAVILERLTQGPDHPVRLSFPEGDYLKGLVVRVE